MYIKALSSIPDQISYYLSVITTENTTRMRYNDYNNENNKISNNMINNNNEMNITGLSSLVLS